MDSNGEPDAKKAKIDTCYACLGILQEHIMEPILQQVTILRFFQQKFCTINKKINFTYRNFRTNPIPQVLFTKLYVLMYCNLFGILLRNKNFDLEPL